MLIKNICSVCGNFENCHKYRHAFDGAIKVKITKTHKFTINCNEYKENKKVECAFPNCSLPEEYHEKRNAQHTFTPTEKIYRNIIFSPSLDTPCKICKIPLEKHEENLSKTHFFSVEVVLKNRKETDSINIIHPYDDEIKILNILNK